ncbi:MAG: tRNA (uridine(34)/cytosine(34)/5-carboxymethylaminomethyluridine(34)-2'-O)-methyltransferase TrmL [Sphaerochaetaceae bacterium]|jgi:tRNA (cytidine/uridine-2'-O-)-methyltransferase|nr:tRNA (uridine(34)/cytosine(34)/5-carboxymethylaminomethyluridine(34)-2'-O)-methyltransferase TrmL [Sphaerochaetaceae bacterium]MDD2407028.1 tRNA (uridine(34)/cytosine(34)/5-carboxymethylaminomethyluridine(34)-2'-O)-methyltransferase TrmL [Sphaerochaetaceae bacterium]MDD3671467.1 tRNA (uridine(34)/cytosine(34)/5-carboxymethylaminomethyluridine(34)-2'-O)-methyltransferase TrmL [Sphaerochaetaceae bacterium]MDD4259477.1 tRNA (uridine(34)/cytosine(34)/5-carboxymethylaminomethyluridine(34)-2'-O)-me
MALHIVLLEPEIPQNTGNIARTCAALGSELHLVHPLGFSLDSRYLKRAGLDYWHLLKIVQWDSVTQFLEHNKGAALWFFTTKAPRTYVEVNYGDDAYLVFGKESAGIPEEILVDHRRNCLRIPMIDEARSLNLSNSVAIAAYEYHRQKQFEGMQASGRLHRLQWTVECQ